MGVDDHVGVPFQMWGRADVVMDTSSSGMTRCSTLSGSKGQ